MPEGDVVRLTAARLHRALAGQPLTVCDLRWPGISTVRLTGAVTVEVVALGKHLLHRVAYPPADAADEPARRDDPGSSATPRTRAAPGAAWTIRSHLRMEGRWDVRATRAGPVRLPQGHDVRAVVGTERALCVGRRLGLLDVVPTHRESDLVGHLGPDVLADAWPAEGRATALANLARAARVHPEAPVAAVLLDQRVVAGLGTIWTSEPLFMTGLDPWTPVSAVGPELLGRVLDLARRHMAASVRASLRHPTTGNPRRDRYVHGQHRQSCLRCGHPIAVRELATRGGPRPFFWCPVCQRRPGLAPAGDEDHGPSGADEASPAGEGRGRAHPSS